MMRHLFTLFLITISLPLLAQIISITLQDNQDDQDDNSYDLNQDGATYTITSNGSPVNARLIVTASAKLILDNCHILRTKEGAPITINAPGVTLEIQIKNTNTICTNYNDNNSAASATSAISSEKTNAPTLIFAEAPNAPASSELLLRGSSTTTTHTPPVQLNKGGSIVFRSGTVRIATSEGGTTGLLIPSLVATNTVTLCGGTVIAQICPREGKPNLTSSSLSSVSNALFACTTFTMTGGELSTAKTSNATPFKPTTTAYDSFFAYSATSMDNLTTAQKPTLAGGIRRSTTKCYIHGLPINTEIPAGAFSYEGSNKFNFTSDATGTITISNIGFYPGLAFKYLDAKAEALVKVFNATPMPTKNGCTAEAQFGISHITIDAESLQTVLHLTLNLINDPSAVLEKTVYVRIYCTVNNEDRVMIAEQPLTFTRNAAGKPFTATFTDVSKARSASTTTRYTIEAYN